MIPIVLTSVAAQPNMGIQVWMLGRGPRHPAQLLPHRHQRRGHRLGHVGRRTTTTSSSARSARRPGKHSFVTEYAGDARHHEERPQLPRALRHRGGAGGQPDPASFVANLQRLGYPFTSQLLAILGRYIPYPTGLAAQGITPPTSTRASATTRARSARRTRTSSSAGRSTTSRRRWPTSSSARGEADARRGGRCSTSTRS